jgi:hypothetical protein
VVGHGPRTQRRMRTSSAAEPAAERTPAPAFAMCLDRVLERPVGVQRSTSQSVRDLPAYAEATLVALCDHEVRGLREGELSVPRHNLPQGFLEGLVVRAPPFRWAAVRSVGWGDHSHAAILHQPDQQFLTYSHDRRRGRTFGSRVASCAGRLNPWVVRQLDMHWRHARRPSASNAHAVRQGCQRRADAEAPSARQAEGAACSPDRVLNRGGSGCSTRGIRAFRCAGYRRGTADARETSRSRWSAPSAVRSCTTVGCAG